MKGKKGFLLGEETLKMIVAVFAILLLIYLLVNLYVTYTKKTKLEKAENRLNELIIKQQMPLAIEKGSADFFLDGPKDWMLIINSDSLCICAQHRIWNIFSNQEQICLKKGICSSSGQYNFVSNEIIIDKTNIKIIYNKPENEFRFIEI